MLAALPEYVVPLTVVAYNAGIRRGELVRIDWDQVDFPGGVIRLYRGKTKTGEPRVVPMIGSMDKVLLEAKAHRDEFHPGCSRVFSRLGEPIDRSPENALRWYKYLRKCPTTRYPGRVFPLRGSMYHGAWECEVTGGDRMYYLPDEAARKVVVYYAGPHCKPAPRP